MNWFEMLMPYSRPRVTRIMEATINKPNPAKELIEGLLDLGATISYVDEHGNYVTRGPASAIEVKAERRHTNTPGRCWCGSFHPKTTAGIGHKPGPNR